MIGSQIGNYRVTAKLGEGGMGAVYRAHDEMLERDVALKVLRAELLSNADVVARFKTEAVALARLSHPNVAGVYGLHLHDGQYVIALEFLEGETVDALLRREQRLSPGRAVDIASTILGALDYAHRRGIVHRDIKASNVMVLPDGTVKVMDFGIARMVGGSHQTRTGFIVGTLGYMAPEQIKGEEVDGRTDIYATGILLYEMLTGRLPFKANSEWALMQAQIEAIPEPPRVYADMPDEVNAAVLKALAKQPGDRYATAQDFRAALQAAIPSATGTVLISRQEDDPTEEITPLPPRSGGVAAAAGPMNWRLWAAVAAAVVVVAVVAGAVLLRGSKTANVQPAAQTQAAGSSSPSPQAAGPAASVSVPNPNTTASTPAPPLPTPAPSATPATPVPARPAAATPAPPTAARNTPTPTRSAAPLTSRPQTMQPAAEPRSGVGTASAPAAGAADVAPAVFDKVRLLQQDAEGKLREVEVEVQLLKDRMEVLARKTRAPLKTIPYRTISAATYSQSKHPRWKQGAGAAVLVGVLAAPVFFMKSTKHWMTLQTADDYAVLRLEKDSQRLFIPAFETRADRKVDIEPAEK